MSNDQYSFGTGLYDAIKSGKCKRTSMYFSFAEKMLQKIGIEVLFSAFDSHRSYLSIEIDMNKYSDFLLNTGGEKLPGYGYSAGDQLRRDILECINVAAEENELPRIDFPSKTSVYFYDYPSSASNVYFHIHAAEIEQATKREFPDQRFIIRWLHGDSKFYYLIFENDEELEIADQKQVTEKIIDFVEAYCKKNDPLNIFANRKLLPKITTKTALQKRGEVMGIMRNNTDFSSW